MRDFTLDKYKELLLCLKNNNYKFLTYEQYLTHLHPEKFVILRHDIDKRIKNALFTADIEKNIGANASYYFRCVKDDYEPYIIQQIVDMGFEIGYHYEDMTICYGDKEKAWNHFSKWLEYFRGFYPVKTICMHGSVFSKIDNKILWKEYNYKSLGVIGEVYLDTDFSDVFYLTDTGRCWDGVAVSIWDKIPDYLKIWRDKKYIYHSTDDIILSANKGVLPNHILITTHPQRWNNEMWIWLYELIRQRIANVIKKIMIINKSHK